MGVEIIRPGSPTPTIIAQLVGVDSALAVDDGVGIIVIPQALDGHSIVGIQAGVAEASTSGAVTLDVVNLRTTSSLFSTALTIDESGYHSKDATTPAVVDSSAAEVQYGDQIRIDVDGAGTGVTGLWVELQFSR